MKTLFIICAMILTAGASFRFVSSFSGKTPNLWGAFWYGLEILSLAVIFRFFY